MHESPIHTRRQFLRTSMIGGALTCTVPAFLQTTMQELHAATLARDAGKKPKGEDPILVVIQLAGGNDGLSVLVPYTNDHYFRARPRLAKAKKDCIALNGELGFHPNLAGLKDLHDDGLLAIVQGVGYPNPNRSHFRSTEIWHTACDSDKTERHGWLGRYFDNQCAGEDAGVGIAIGKETPQAFFASKPKGITFQRPRQYRFVGSGQGAAGSAETELFMAMNEPDDEAGGSIGRLSGGRRNRPDESPLSFLERTALDARVSSDDINRIVGRARNERSYPRGPFANDLGTVAKLIAGDMDTQIYYVSMGGYDTHGNQAGPHDRLMNQFNGAFTAFVRDLERQGNLDRVQILVFSEFGRRVAENGSGGTDHGAAAPLFLAGGGLAPGLHGDHPSLDPKDLDRGDLVHAIDFRSVYATIVEKHLGAPSEPILRGRFPLLDIMA
jgi:uncharacterized protein (DUF1501 family)